MDRKIVMFEDSSWGVLVSGGFCLSGSLWSCERCTRCKGVLRFVGGLDLLFVVEGGL